MLKNVNILTSYLRGLASVLEHKFISAPLFTKNCAKQNYAVLLCLFLPSYEERLHRHFVHQYMPHCLEKDLLYEVVFFPFCTDIHFCTNVKLKLYSSVLYVYTSYEWRPASGFFFTQFSSDSLFIKCCAVL